MRTRAIGVIALLSCLAGRAGADELTPGERQRLLAHLDMTESWLVSEVSGLSKSQVAFKMTPDSWSITEVVEHLAIAEPQWCLMISSHAQRHILQIREIKASAGYPRA